MAWSTWLQSHEELVIGGRSIIRIGPKSRNAHVVVETVEGEERMEIVKRPRTDPVNAG